MRRLSLLIFYSCFACIIGSSSIMLIVPTNTPLPTAVPTEFETSVELPTAMPTDTPEKCLIVIANKSLYLRVEPTMNSKALTWLSNGETVKPIYQDEGWWFVKADSFYGYVKSEFVEACQ